jgi:hypothetical protein
MSSPALSSTGSSKASTGLGHSLPTALLQRTVSYDATSFAAPGTSLRQAQQTAWHHRHRDAPAVFRQSRSIDGFWSQEQCAAIDRHWPNGWTADECGPLMKLTGAFRHSTPHHHATAASVLQVRASEHERCRRRSSQAQG